jgi:hypothetical protein
MSQVVLGQLDQGLRFCQDAVNAFRYEAWHVKLVSEAPDAPFSVRSHYLEQLRKLYRDLAQTAAYVGEVGARLEGALQDDMCAAIDAHRAPNRTDFSEGRPPFSWHPHTCGPPIPAPVAVPVAPTPAPVAVPVAPILAPVAPILAPVAPILAPVAPILAPVATPVAAPVAAPDAALVAVHVAPGSHLTLDARIISDSVDAVTGPGLHYIPQWGQFAIRVGAKVWHAGIGQIYELPERGKRAEIRGGKSSVRECRKAECAGKLHGCNAYHDPSARPPGAEATPEVRNFPAESWLYQSVAAPSQLARGRKFGSATSLDVDLLAISEEDARTFQAQVAHDLICALVLQKYVLDKPPAPLAPARSQ